jgi:hypothetical protein
MQSAITEIDYLRRRESQERAAAERSASPARNLHLQLADQYAASARRLMTWDDGARA